MHVAAVATVAVVLNRSTVAPAAVVVMIAIEAVAAAAAVIVVVVVVAVNVTVGTVPVVPLRGAEAGVLQALHNTGHANFRSGRNPHNASSNSEQDDKSVHADCVVGASATAAEVGAGVAAAEVGAGASVEVAATTATASAGVGVGAGAGAGAGAGGASVAGVAGVAGVVGAAPLVEADNSAVTVARMPAVVLAGRAAISAMVVAMATLVAGVLVGHRPHISGQNCRTATPRVASRQSSAVWLSHGAGSAVQRTPTHAAALALSLGEGAHVPHASGQKA